jgi:hypothetical protein
MRVGWTVACLLFAGLGCRSAGGAGSGASNAATVAAVTAVAGGLTALNLAAGQCATDCPPDTHCSPKTGLCERGRDDSPCGRTGCPRGKVCDVNSLLPQCVDESTVAGQIDTERLFKPFRPFPFSYYWYYWPAVQPFPSP